MISLNKSKIERPRITGAHPPVISVHVVGPLGSVGQSSRGKSARTFRSVKRMHPAWIAMSVLMTTSFIAGMVTVWQTQLSVAETEDNRSGGLVALLDKDEKNLNVVADLLPVLIKENRHEPTLAEIQSKERKEKLRSYLASKKSVLATDEEALDAFLSSNNMEMMLAISFVEGNFCKHHVAYNCSGIGGSKMHKYESFADWVRAFDNLLERKYKGLKGEEFIGFYVVPGTDNWKTGVYQILGELKERGL